jgi:hypothetical protein
MAASLRIGQEPTIDLRAEMRDEGAWLFLWYVVHGWEGLAQRLALELLALEEDAPLEVVPLAITAVPVTRHAHYAGLKAAAAHRPRQAMWDRTTTLRALTLWMEEYHRWPVAREMCPAEGLPNDETIRRLWGTPAAWHAAYETQYGPVAVPTIAVQAEGYAGSGESRRHRPPLPYGVAPPRRGFLQRAAPG